MEKVKIRLRSFEDPTIQALIMTHGTFAIGMDPDLKFYLSIAGIAVSSIVLISIFWHIFYKVCSKERGESKQSRAR